MGQGVECGQHEPGPDFRHVERRGASAHARYAGIRWLRRLGAALPGRSLGSGEEARSSAAEGFAEDHIEVA